MAAAGAHRYWRLFIVTGYNQTTNEIHEIELRTSAGGSDITTPSTPVTASSTYPGYPESNVVDNSTATPWASNEGTSTNNWLRFDLTTPAAVAEVALYSMGAGPATVKIQYSDNGSTWTDATSTITLSNTNSWQTIAVEQAPPDPNAPQKTILTLSLAGATGWTNPSYLTASGGNYAYRSLDNTSNYSATFNSNAASALPAGAVILGVEVSYKAYVDTTAPATQVFTSFPVSPASYPTTSEVLYTKGGPTNKLGVNSAADLATPWLRVGNTAGGSATLYVNSFSIAVYWQMPKAGNALFFGELF